MQSLSYDNMMLLLLLAFQIISGHVWTRFSSYPGIPTPLYKRGRLHSDFVGLLSKDSVSTFLYVLGSEQESAWYAPSKGASVLKIND